MQKIKRAIHSTSNSNGLNKTLQLMNIAEEIALHDLDFKIFLKRNFSQYSYDKDVLVYRVWEYMKHNFKFKTDEFDETIINPRLMPLLRAGDCDDFALFTKTVLKFFGIDSVYVLLAKEKNNYSHIAILANQTYVDATSNLFNQYPPAYKYMKAV